MSEYLRPEYTPLFREVQETIAGYLNSDPQISAKQIEFIPEARLDIDFQVKKALGQQGIVGVVNTLKGEFAGHNGSTNAWQIEAEVDVIENPPVRRSQLKRMGLSTGTVSDIIDWVQESMCGPSSPTFARFSPVTQEIGEEKGLVVGRSIMRSIVIADVSAVISGGNQWKCPYALQQDLSALAAQVEEIEYDISGKADVSDLDNYLPLSGGTMFDTIGFSPDADWEHGLGYKLIQLNQTGENWQALFGVDDNNGQPYVAHNGSETGTGEIQEYTWKLWFPDENGTLATQEWTQGEISGKTDLSALSDYLPLSGGDMTGAIGIAVGSDFGIQFGSDKMWWGPGGISLAHDSDDYCIFPVGYGSQTEDPNLLAKKGDLSSFIKATAMTQAEYDQITPDPTTLYVITES